MYPSAIDIGTAVEDDAEDSRRRRRQEREKKKKRKETTSASKPRSPTNSRFKKKQSSSGFVSVLVERRTQGSRQQREQRSQPILEVSRLRRGSPQIEQSQQASQRQRKEAKGDEKETKTTVKKGKKDKKKHGSFACGCESDIRSDLNPARIQPLHAKERSVRTLKRENDLCTPSSRLSSSFIRLAAGLALSAGVSPFDLAKIQPAGPIFGYRATLWP